VLNRDVALRVHTPGGPAAREWITRALTAGGLATPALAMVYDAAEGTGGTEPGGAAYVVNEWIEGTRLSDRLAADGPLPERDARAVVRRLAEGVAEAHRVGLAVGGLTAEHVVLRPGGLVGLLSVPAATGTEKGDIAALGALLELCLTGSRSDLPGAPPTVISSPDLAALVRRARSTDPATGLSNVSTMVALLAERPRPGTGPQEAVRPDGYTDTGWMRRLRDRREPTDGGEEPVRLARHALPPVPGAPLGRARPAADDEDDLDWGETFSDEDAVGATEAPTTTRRRLAVVGLPLLALALVVAFALWFGTNVLSVAGNVEQVHGSSPSATGTSAAASGGPAGTAPSSAPAPAPAPVAGAPVPITAAAVFDPYGDGESENAKAAPKSFDGNPATAWTTLNYRGSADFGHLKPGVGIVYDLGSAKPLAGVTVTTTLPGSTVEVRTGSTPGTTLDAFPVAASARLTGTDKLAFTAPVTARYVLVWVTGLVSGSDGYSANLAEVTITAAG
jgi:hypothetical protein